MASIVWSDVTSASNADPMVAGFDAGGTVMILGTVNTMLNVDMFDGEAGMRTKLARCAMAAHMAVCLSNGDAGGPVTSQSEGGVSQSYASMMSPQVLMTTGFGRLYLSLIGPQAFGPRLL